MILFRVAALFWLGGLVWGCQPAAEPETVAEVNGQPITLTELRRNLVGYSLEGQSGAEVVNKVLEDLINQSLILQEAAALGLSVSPEELDQAEARIREDYPGKSFDELLLTQALDHQEWRQALKRRLLIEKTTAACVEPRLKVDPSQVERVVKSLQGKETKDQIKVAQILTNNKDSAVKARQELTAGRPFAEVARRYSALAGQAGEEIDYFSRGEMPEQLEEAVWSLKPGQASQVVRSDYGWHVFVVLDQKTSSSVDKRQVADMLKRRLKAKLQTAWLKELKSRAKIKIYTERLSLGLKPKNEREK